MKIKPEKKYKQRRFDGSNFKFKKTDKPEEKKLAVNLRASNGTSNWDQLAKVLGYGLKKPKSLAMTGKSSANGVGNSTGKHTTQSTMNGSSMRYRDALCGAKPDVLATKNSNTPESTTMSYAAMLKSNKNSSVSTEIEPTSFPRRNSWKSKRNGSKSQPNENAAQDEKKNEPKEVVISKNLTKYLAMDCEMVGTGSEGKDSMLARVSIVNQYGDCVYDTFVKPVEEITDFRTPISGVRPSDLKKGKDLYTVQKDVLDILKDRVLVGHALKNDMDVLFISHPKKMIRDTARYKPFRQLFDGRTPSLKKLSEKLLGVDIQSGEHSSVEDAQAAMQVFLTHKSEWEKSLKSKSKGVKHSTKTKNNLVNET